MLIQSRGVLPRWSGPERPGLSGYLRREPEFCGCRRSLDRFERMTPPQTGETGIVAVGGDPFASALDGQGGQVGVGNPISLRLCAPAKVAENAPVSRARCDHHALGPFAELIRELEGRLDGVGMPEDTGLSHDANETA